MDLSVADSGPGIPPADRPRVMERFVRLEASRNSPGTGLGLSLVAAVAHFHNAELVLEDNAPRPESDAALPATGDPRLMPARAAAKRGANPVSQPRPNSLELARMPAFRTFLPLPFDPARVAARAGSAGRARLHAAERRRARCWTAAFGNSAFLGRLALREPEALADYFAAGPAGGAERGHAAGAWRASCR